MMGRSYLKIEYLDDTQRPKFSFLSLSFSTENAEMYFARIHIKKFYIIYS